MRCWLSVTPYSGHGVGMADPNGAISRLVFAALDGLVLQHSIYRSVERTEAVLDRLCDVLRLLQKG
ncbi:hypothetical protein [Modestobacter sp. URMC 112]